MAVIDNGSSATLFVSNTGFGVGAPPAGPAVAVPKATIVRIGLDIPSGGKPRISSMTVVADGFGEAPDKGVFIIGPTGVAPGPNGSIYVSDALGNRIVAIPDALTRTTSAGTGTEITSNGFLKRPLALVTAPNGNLLVTNGLNGQVVEIDPVARKQVAAQWIDVDKAQQPAGSGDLFGLAMTPKGDGFYYVEDDVNTLVLAH
jgi:glucose/arabinose dehydrogenase